MTDGATGRRVPLWLVFGLCLAAALLEGFDNQSVGAVAPRLNHAFGLKPGELAPVLTASTVGLLLGAALGGRLSDRFGFRRVLAAMIGLMGLASLASAFCPDLNSLFVARFFTGLGLGGSMPNVLALTSGVVAQARRGAAVSAVYAGMPLGGALSAAVTLFGSAEDWKTVFLVGGLIPAALAPALLLLPDRVQSARATEDRHVASIAKVLFGEGRATATLLLWISFMLTLLILYMMLAWLPTLTASRGYDAKVVASVQMAFNLAGGLACIIAGRLLDGRHRWLFIVLAYALLTLSLAGLAFLHPEASWEIALGGGLGAGVLLSQAVLYDAGPRLYPAAMRGTGVGWAVAMGRIGSVAGPILGGLLLAHGSSPADVLMRLIPFVVLGWACTVLQAWRARGPEAASVLAE